MSKISIYPSYSSIFRLIPYSANRFKRGNICLYATCDHWSSAFYCSSRHSSCRCSSYALWQLAHGLPSGDNQLTLF